VSGRPQGPLGLDVALRAMIIEVVRDVVKEEIGRAVAKTSSDEYLSPAEAARIASVAPGTIRRWMREGRIATHRAGRSVRVRRTDLVVFLRAERKPAPTMTPEQLADRDFARG
jgi:excisionase family DNA binding protein